ncbi:MAG TPA: GGDEF domain-containing protein [Gammaproteobacteria bacterium]|nr:GGDEF domain-containing protein [Gammaproteobacteria bacterium]
MTGTSSGLRSGSGGASVSLADDRCVEDDAVVARRQRLRKQRLAMAIGDYLIFAGVAFYLFLTGEIALPLWGMLLYLAAIAAANLVFWILIATGRNLRFRDASLTRAQLLTGFAFQISMMAFARTVFAQDICILSFLLSLLFGGLQLNRRQIAAVSIPAFVIFVALMLWRYQVVDQMILSSIARAAIYALVFGGIAFFAGYISSLRSHLSARNKELREAMNRIGELANTDSLTGAFNRRYIEEALGNEIIRTRRTGSPFSVCLLDVDRFKNVNDSHGHLVGDEVLRGLVANISEAVRTLDRVGHRERTKSLGRFGGEEFLLILPTTTLEGARTCAERIREMVASTSVATDIGSLTVTVSGGVAEYQPGEKPEALLQRADKALYQAKEQGRNRINGSLAAPKQVSSEAAPSPR